MIFNKRNTKQPNQPNKEEDDQVVANMNVDGMPWHRPGIPLYDQSRKEPLPELDKKELRRLTIGATLGGLLIGAVFIIVFFLFVMFCIHIWF